MNILCIKEMLLIFISSNLHNYISLCIAGFKLEKLKCHRSKLVIGVKFDMNWLASEFVALGILSTQHQDDISNIRSTLTSDERANIMVSAIMDKLELDSTNLLNILKVLRKKPELYKEIIALLEGTNYCVDNLLRK